jgi:hypothetical protein
MTPNDKKYKAIMDLAGHFHGYRDQIPKKAEDRS